MIFMNFSSFQNAGMCLENYTVYFMRHIEEMTFKSWLFSLVRFLELISFLYFEKRNVLNYINTNYFAEIMATKQTGRPYRDTRYVDVYREKQIRVVVKVLVPVKEHPKVRQH